LAASAPVILWFRRDLRLDDNLALLKAVKSGRPVVPVYVKSEGRGPFSPLGAAQDWWLHHSLAELGDALAERGSRLVLRSGEPHVALVSLAREIGAEVVAVNAVPDPHAAEEDRQTAERLGDAGIAFHAFAGALLHDPTELKTGAGTGFRVYTPFWRALSQHAPPSPPLDTPGNWTGPSAWPESEPLESFGLLPTKTDWATGFSPFWQAGEQAALARLDDFTDNVLKGYAESRDLPGVEGTSRLSPHLAMGEISPRRVWHAVEARRGKGPSEEDISRCLKELAWRDFCHHLLHHFPDLARRNWNARFDAFAWDRNDAGFEAWTRGMTGYPIVDAGMRQLWRHGWMHNRVRMITGSFLIKDLLTDWREGEAWFRDTLVDADPASNAANWQWVAGSGADASPFFRIFNPILQGEKFDPAGDYIRAFVPELARLPNSLIHRPFEASAAELRAAGVTLGQTYPHPVVDHRTARDEALSRLARLKDENGQALKKIRER
jgi:deoxyribodipyrimidine photo-lyase